MKKLNFRTSSGIKSIVGRDLITDKFIAIFELVKNGYDAKASEVVVSFNNIENSAPKKEKYVNNKREKTLEEELQLENHEPHIVIKDNGCGMDEDSLINKWLYLAYSDKKEGAKNEDRTFVGSKGIGRFSCDTLGAVLNIQTKKANENIEHVLVVNWSNFEENQKIEFENVAVKYGVQQKINTEAYTILTIRDLRSHLWSDNKELDRVRRQLERLKNPFKNDDGFSIYVGNDLSLKKLDPRARVFNNISEIIKDRTVTIEAIIGENIDIELYDRGTIIYKASKKNETVLKDTPIIISINYLSFSAKKIFTERMGIRPLDYGNIFVYKNNFRVMPYGDADVDLFGLNLRKNQGYSRFISARETIGYIDIQDKNQAFKEASSRNNGFVKNIYLLSLDKLYVSEIHSLLESFVRLVKWGEDYVTKEEILFDPNHNDIDKFKRYITSVKGYGIEYFKGDLEFEQNKPEKQLDKIIAESEDDSTKKIAREIKKKINELKDTNQKISKKIIEKEKKEKKLDTQIKNLTKIREPDLYYVQISHHFSAMSERLRHTIDSLNKYLNKLNPEDKHKALIEIYKIRKTQYELDLFGSLLINTDIDMRSKQMVNWYDQALWFMQEKEGYDNPKVSCEINDDENIKKWDFSTYILDLQMALENFYQNARDNKAIYFNILFDEEKIVISSDSTKIAENDLDKIKELGYTTKPNGTGIGLHQITCFLKDHSFDLSINQDDNLVSFIIQKKDK